MTDWRDWHAAYDDPTSSLARRLMTVRAELGDVLRQLPPGPVQLVSLCSGDGRDTISMLERERPDARALLVELDPVLAQTARDAVDAAGLGGVEVLTADAGLLSTYDATAPAQVLMTCGVFGNVTDAGVELTVRHLPLLLADGARVIWTRGSAVPDDPTHVSGDAADWVRGVFADTGFVEEDFVRPDDADYRVGVHRWPGGPLPEGRPERLFDFVPAKQASGPV